MFKFGRKVADHSPTAVSIFTTHMASTAAAGRGRRELLQQISNFLLDHDLAVNPGNLTLAQAVFSGSDSELSRRVMARQLANEPVTQAWLDELTETAAHISEQPGGRETRPPTSQDAGLDQGPAPVNTRAIAELVVREYHAARAAPEPLSIAFCDIDRVQAINEIHGPDVGDRVISAIARMLQRVCGQDCHIARDGDNGFVLLFRGLSPEEAGEKLDTARESFAHRKLVDRKTHREVGTVTFSGGVADALAFSDPQAALQAADEALQAAKDRGRNRIVVAGKGT